MKARRGLRNTLPQRWPLEQRIEHHSIPEPNSGCVLWLGPINNYGYPRLEYERQDILIHRHRLAEKLGRPLLSGEVACHRCDVPCCINPAHLFLGTQADNLADMRAKGRGAKGERISQSKLTAEQVGLIRNDPRGSTTLAGVFGIDARQIRRIRQRKNWAHVQ